MNLTFLVAAASGLLLAGCAAVPGQGPLSGAIAAAAKSDAPTEEASAFHVVEMSDAVVATLLDVDGPSLRGSFGTESPAPQQMLAIGDTLTISIFESASGGLFFGGDPTVSSGARQITLPSQTIGQDGMVSIPYVGKLKAAGQKTTSLATLIETKLDERAIEPQVVIAVESSVGNTATVMGEVANGGQVDLGIDGERLLDVLADASIKLPESEAVIRLVRRGKSQTVALSTIISNPAENIYVFPDDTIIVLKDAQVFNVIGAVNTPGQYEIGSQSQTFAGALSLAGGLAEASADRGGVFVFRFESERTARALLGPDIVLKQMPAGIPVVYRIRFSDPSSFFWLQQLRIRRNDMIYVSTAFVREFDKFLSIVTKTAAIGTRLSDL